MARGLHEVCNAGRTGVCLTQPAWALRRPGDTDDSWAYACGRHLHFVATEVTGGEQGDIELRRILTDER